MSVTDDEYNKLLNNGKEIYQEYFTLEKMCLNILGILENSKTIKI
jgi:hypothetical protein